MQKEIKSAIGNNFVDLPRDKEPPGYIVLPKASGVDFRPAKIIDPRKSLVCVSYVCCGTLWKERGYWSSIEIGIL